MQKQIKVEDKQEIYSKRVRAGKRTYFFDIKSTRANDYFLTITESRKRFKDDGVFYEKHKIFLYKEDVLKFTQSLEESLNYLKNELLPEFDFTKENTESDEDSDLKWE